MKPQPQSREVEFELENVSDAVCGVVLKVTALPAYTVWSLSGSMTVT